MANIYLGFAVPGKTYRVTEIAGGHGAQKRLQDLGIVPGSELSIIQNDEHHPILIKANETVLMIGKGIAKKIIVEEVVYASKADTYAFAAEKNTEEGQCHS